MAQYLSIRIALAIFQQLLPLVNFRGYLLVLLSFLVSQFFWEYKLDFVVACGDISEIILVTCNWMKSVASAIASATAATPPITPSSGLLLLSVSPWIGLLLRLDYSLDYFRLSPWLSIWLFTSPSSIKWESFAEYQKGWKYTLNQNVIFCSKITFWVIVRKLHFWRENSNISILKSKWYFFLFYMIFFWISVLRNIFCLRFWSESKVFKPWKMFSGRFRYGMRSTKNDPCLFCQFRVAWCWPLLKYL